MLCRTLWFSAGLLTTHAFADNACSGLNLLEVSAALRGLGTLYGSHAEMQEKKTSFCGYKRAVGGPFPDSAALRAADGPEVVLAISDPGGPMVVDPKIMDSAESVPSLGDRAAIITAPLSNSPGAHLSYLVVVLTGTQSYSVVYEPTVMDQQSRNIAIQLAREVLLVRSGFLTSYPIAEQIVSSDKAAIAEKGDSVELWNEIGALSYSLKRYSDARDAYLKITQLLPDEPGGYFGLALTAWKRSFSERMERRAMLGLRPMDDTILDPKYKDFCETFKREFQAIINEGCDSAKKALQMHPESSEYAAYAMLLAKEKAATDCQEAAALKADTSEADRLSQISIENQTAEASSGKKYVSKIWVGPDEIPPPPPPPPGLPTGGVLGHVISASPANSTGSPILGRVLVAEGIEDGLLLNKVSPVYPPLARQARIQGAVNLKAIIDKEGSVQSLNLISGHPMLVPAAMDAVKQWKYKPYLWNGKSVSVETTIQVNFELQKDP